MRRRHLLLLVLANEEPRIGIRKGLGLRFDGFHAEIVDRDSRGRRSRGSGRRSAGFVGVGRRGVTMEEGGGWAALGAPGGEENQLPEGHGVGVSLSADGED